MFKKIKLALNQTYTVFNKFGKVISLIRTEKQLYDNIMNKVVNYFTF